MLLTSYEMLRDDAELLEAIHWRGLVVDEAHRLKNKDSAVAAQIHALDTEHMLMMTGTPLQNNTTELWALLSLLDPQLFPSLDDFKERYGTLTQVDQVDELKSAIRPYLLQRQKGDVLKGDDSLAPLEETIVWVEMTLLQKKMYRAVLETRRDVLVRGLDHAPLLARLHALSGAVLAREVPLLLPPGPEDAAVGFVAGAIDLLYRDPEDGRLVVVDYKTDHLRDEADLPARAASHAGQGTVYRRAVQDSQLEQDFKAGVALTVDIWKSVLSYDVDVELPDFFDNPWKHFDLPADLEGLDLDS